MISAWEFVSHQINKSLCTLSFKCSLTNSKQAVTSVLPTVASVSLLCWSKGLICRDQLRSRPAGYLISAENVSVLCVSWNEACFVLFIPINKLYLHMQCYECVLHLKPLWWCLHENLFIINWRFVKPGRNKCNLFRVVSVPVDCLVVFSLLLITWLTKLICGLVFVSSAFRQRSCGWKCAGLTSNSLIRHFMHGSSTVSESCWSDVCWRWRPDTPRLIFDLICEPRKTFELVALPESRRELKCCECFTKRSSLNPDYVRMCTRHPDYSVQTVIFHKPEGP